MKGWRKLRSIGALAISPDGAAAVDWRRGWELAAAAKYNVDLGGEGTPPDGEEIEQHALPICRTVLNVEFQNGYSTLFLFDE